MKSLVLRTICGIGVFGCGAAIYSHWHAPSPSHAAQPTITEHEPPKSGHRVVRSGTDELLLPDGEMEKMSLKTTLATAATNPISLPSFQGVLALDNDRLSRIHTRFGGEVVEIGKSTDGSDPTLRVGERVNRGDVLAVIWSTELGKKKSELVDALTKLRSEEQLRDRLKTLFDEGAGPGRNYRDAERDVQIRLVEVASLERTLRTWRITEEELRSIRNEVNRLAQADELSEAMMPADEVRRWAKVEVRAPISGVILEKNIVVGDIVGTEEDLFKIGDLSQLAVWAHVYEDDLPLLETLPTPIQWTVTLPSRPGVKFPGTLEKVGAVIDPTQHTALMSGRVANQGGALRIGQFVNVTVTLPPPENELELPATAVVEDGTQSLVFIQAVPNEPRFQKIPVQVTRRFRDRIYVRSSSEGLRPETLVVTSGALMLQNALEQLPAPTMAKGQL